MGTAVIPHRIAGVRTPGAAASTAPVTNPATGQVTGDVVLATEADVDAAAASAAAAFPAWWVTSSAERTAVLFRFRELLDARKPELAALITAEHGEVLDDALGEVPHAHGLDGVLFSTRSEVVTTRWLDPSHGGLDLGFPQNA